MDSHGHSCLTLSHIASIVHSLTNATHLCVAYSGGLDSHVLLDALVCAFSDQPRYEISALHIHHGISQYAEQWAQHCAAVCKSLQTPLTILRVDGKAKNGQSPEESARHARFSAFKHFLQPGHALLLGHHQADQAETILLRLFRGSGPLGLGGMLAKNRLGQGELIRPLLNITKQEMRQYAKHRNLQWIEDDSNLNNRFDRNYLRNAILPLLRSRWSRIDRSISRSGELCLETLKAQWQLAEQDIENIAFTENAEDVQARLSVSQLLKLDPVRRRAVLRLWLHRLGLALPSFDHLLRIDREILQAKAGSKPRLKIDQYEIIRLRDALSVVLLAAIQ